MSKVSYMGNCTTVEFYFDFPYFEKDNVVVLKNNKPATGYDIVGVSAGENADFPFVGGKVVFGIAPSSLDSIDISRKLPLMRVVDYQPMAKIDSKLLNQDVNYLMEALKDFQEELNGFSERYDEFINKESVGVLLTKIGYIENLIQNETLVTNEKFYSYMSNCITEISQDIKLELLDGALTLKAGSKVYVPNGAGIFNPVVIADDLVCPAISGNRIVAIYRTNTGVLNYQSLDTMSAGASDSLADVQWHVWYDTVNNVVNRYLEDTNIAVAGQSLPIGIISVVDGVITEIKQVFNGFGYIGGIVFTLPGVKGLIPNGRNEDGTLKNVLLNCTSVQISSDFSTFDSLHSLFLGSNGRCAWYAPDGFIYDVDDNKIYHSTNGTPLISMDAGIFDVVKGKIINFNPKNVFSVCL